uniref:Autophagy protein 5 n=1 Tax=Rhabditophanes sp. KR3021 TaxID=114890 RepID=A0AC35UGL4_9BILA
MEHDKTVCKLVWDAKVPIYFVLEDSKVLDSSEKISYMTTLPRISYFPLHYEDAIRFFTNFNPDLKKDKVWLEYTSEKQYIKWWYPIGVLYDIIQKDKNSMAPLKLTIRFGEAPDGMISYKNSELQAMFLYSIKEADQLRHAGKVLAKESKETHEALFRSVEKTDFNTFWEIVKNAVSDHGKVSQFLPIRFYVDGTKFVQFQIKGDETLQQILPKVCKQTEQANFRLVCHGIELPLATTADYIATNLIYPDSFAHIVVEKQ